MHFTTPLLLALAASTSAYTSAVQKCATPPPTSEFLAVHADHAQQAAGSPGLVARQEKPFVNFTLNVYAHVIESDISDANIASQIDVLNNAFNISGLTFKLVSTTRTSNPRWVNIRLFGNPEREMKSALKKGSFHDLNLYFTTSLDSRNNNLLGFAYFPSIVRDNVNYRVLDGVLVNPQSVPGGSFQPYDLGITAVHEVGHWFGLLHTFQDGCFGEGDNIADTPAEASAAFGCQTGRDTCPEAGVDPIHNIMDYSDDSCLTDPFTPLQIRRIQTMFDQYRRPDVQPEGPGTPQIDTDTQTDDPHKKL